VRPILARYESHEEINFNLPKVNKKVTYHCEAAAFCCSVWRNPLGEVSGLDSSALLKPRDKIESLLQ